MLYRDAQVLASNRDLDLVRVNQAEGVEVFKIMDYGKWKYEKKKHKQKKPQHQTKEMNFKLRIDPHDQGVKLDRIKKFLSKGDDVKISVQLRGREKANPRQAQVKLDEILKTLEGEIQIQQRRSSQFISFAVIRAVKKKTHEQNTRKRNVGRNDQTVGNTERIDDGHSTGNEHGNKSTNTSQNQGEKTSTSAQRRVVV